MDLIWSGRFLRTACRAVSVCLVVFLGASFAFAWDGTDVETGGSVSIGKGNLVRPGRTIEIFDYEAGEYRDVEVQDMNSTGSGVEIEIFDHDSGTYRTLEFDD